MNRLRNQRSQDKLIKLGDYVEHWYKTYKMSTHALTTVQVQLNYINTHIKPSKLGDTYINSVREADIQKFLNLLLENGNRCKLKNSKTFGKPLAKETVKKILGVITAAMK